MSKNWLTEQSNITDGIHLINPSPTNPLVPRVTVHNTTCNVLSVQWITHDAIAFCNIIVIIKIYQK